MSTVVKCVENLSFLRVSHPPHRTRIFRSFRLFPSSFPVHYNVYIHNVVHSARYSTSTTSRFSHLSVWHSKCVCMFPLCGVWLFSFASSVTSFLDKRVVSNAYRTEHFRCEPTFPTKFTLLKHQMPCVVLSFYEWHEFRRAIHSDV